MFGRQHTPQDFWKWFVAHDRILYDFEQDQERVFDKLASKMRQIDPHLTFEFGPKTDAGREFVISAGGIKTSFSAVTALVSAAPRLTHWQVTAFRPRRPPICSIELRGKRADPREVQFSLVDNGKDVGVYLFLPGYDEQDITWKEIGYLLLDETLGEFDVETKVGLIRFFSRDLPANQERFSLIDLPALFDRHVLTLQQRNGISPSQPN